MPNNPIKRVITKDGSTSFFSERFKETYHSITGTKEEALEKFVKPCNIKNNYKILDVCFGLGYKTATALTVAPQLEIIGLENDPEILQEIAMIVSDIPSYNIIKQLAATKDLFYKHDQCSIKILLDDARVSIKHLATTHNNYFHAVFLDPFSPKACPELWTEEFFRDIYTCMKHGGILTTYSCARIVRDNLKKVGFSVRDGPCIGRRAPSTIASKS